MSKSRPILNFLDFSRTFSGPSHPSRIDHHEHRAPTDASVRLLMEMEEKAMANIVGRISTPASTGIEAEWIISRSPVDETLTFHCVYAVNGQRQEFKTTKTPRNFVKMNINDLLKEVIQELISHLARQFATPLLKATCHAFNPEITARFGGGAISSTGQ